MAGEIQAEWTTGLTVYFLVHAPAGNTIWNGSALVSYNSANYSTYPVAGTELGTSGYFTGDMPAVAAGTYNVVAKLQAGGSPAETDVSIAEGVVPWDGTAVLSLLSAIPTTGNTANTIADCLNAARGQSFGAWKIVGTTLTIYAPDGTTPIHVFTLDSAVAPTQRV